jgi:predicted DNA-binding transcriptional regulator YafY
MQSKEKATQNPVTHDCPRCFNIGESIVINPMYIDYQCKTCGYKFRFTHNHNEEKQNKKQEYTGIVVREASQSKSASSTCPWLETIQKCMKNTQLLRFLYQSGPVEKERTVEPYKLMKSKNGIVLYALCLAEGNIRMFYVNNMMNVQEDEMKFTPKYPIVDSVQNNS